MDCTVDVSPRVSNSEAVVAMVHAKDGSMLSVGRRTRTIPPHIRRALEERDRGCRFPGCGCTFTEAHHVKHWADGGKTSLRNTLLLCRRHHRAVREGRVKVSVNSDGTVLFFMPNGRMLVDAPKQSLLVGTRRQHVGADAWRERGRTGGSARPAQVDWEEQRADSGLPPVPSVYPHAPAKGKDPILSNGAALYCDSAIPWEIEAAAREAMEDSL
ncbi:MAG: HNH endonuclease [Gammaproteobacteria bacterium]|nr:HNH endonuclease [Gammaproteobacteria bacterium]